jgi:glycosyltransferase involved in cell wall biosynthesis
VIVYGLILFCTGTVFLICLYNYFTAPVTRKKPGQTFSDRPLISVLIPARNEEKNITGCLISVIAQTYGTLEIIVLDDDSKDRTAEIVGSMQRIDERVSLIKGKKLPEGWLGKNWACSQLAEHAGGRYLLFIDADVRLQPEAIAYAIGLLKRKQVSMVSVFPTQEIKSPGAWLIVPLMNWLLLSFLPLRKVYSSPNPSFVAANGQFILIERRMYKSMGGHDSVRNKIEEDMEIARNLKKGGHRVLTALGGRYIFCKMYDGFKDSFNGFSKNFFPGFNTSASVFITLSWFAGIIQLAPFIVPFIGISATVPLLLVLAGRGLISVRSGQNPLINIILHPIQMILMMLIGIYSVLLHKRKRVRWKDRVISPGTE